MEYVLDIQGFKQPVSDYIVKELAIVPLDKEKKSVVFLFQPPYPWGRLTDKYKRENTWLEQYYHGIPWDSGTVPYNLLKDTLKENLSDATKVYVLGEIYKIWLHRFNFVDFQIENILERGFPSMDRKMRIATVCTHHNESTRATCALHNARRARQYLLDISEPLYVPMDCSK